MTPLALVHRWTGRLAATALTCALAVGVATAGVGYAVALALGMSAPASWVLALSAGSAAVVADGWRRLRGRLTATRVALWLEERSPALQYALVSAVEGNDASGWCAARVRAVDVSAPGWRAVRRALAGPLAAAALGAVAFVVAPSLAARRGEMRDVRTAHAPLASPFSPIRGRIEPPMYARRPVEDIPDPDVLHPLAGSRVTLHGSLPTSARGTIAVTIDDMAAEVDQGENEWTVRVPADSVPRVVRLEHAGVRRMVVVEPVADSVPVVALEHPSRDSILAEPRAAIALSARASDDLGLAALWFEYIVSSGEGERYTFRSGTLARRAVAGHREAVATATLDVASLQLAAGDVVHLRAVARDANTVTGPGLGASETRTFRIARPGEADSVAVDPAAPPDVDTSLLSQRMLINLTESLARKAGTMEGSAVTAESRRIGRDQARLRKQVSDLVFARLGDTPSGEHFHGDGHAHGEEEPLKRNLTPQEVLAAAERATGGGASILDNAHDETPVVAVNRPLLEAYNAMWDAGRELETGRPRAALPPMYVALAAIQRARAAERLYLRGAPPRVVVDLARARLAGKDRGVSAVRGAAAASPAWRRAALARLQRALGVAPASAAADSLLVLRLSLVGRMPAAVAALESLVAEVRAGHDATAATVRVRRTLDGGADARDATALWGGRRP